MIKGKNISPVQVTTSPQARIEGSVIIIFSILIAWVFVPDTTPFAVASHYALYIAIGITLSLLFEIAVMGLGRVIRADCVCLVVFYALSYLEFLFDQPELNQASTLSQTQGACALFNLGFVSMVISRHFWPTKRIIVSNEKSQRISFKVLLAAFWIAFALGFFHIFWAVDFNPIRAIEEMMRPRFSQSWGRGRLGDWNALLVELGLLIYLIPPLFGALLALRRSIPRIHLMLTTPVFIFTLFYGFSSGTRNIFGIYAITFFVAYLINLERLRWGRVILFSLAVLGVTALASFHMLEFRNMGLKKYLEDEAYQDEALRDTLFIDFNLRYLGVVQEVFPERYDYLGFEVLVWAIVKPIPRAIWPGKPEGLSVSIEEATNVEQMSVATTWVGESFLAFGRVGVVATGLTIGLICGFWNRRGSQYASPMQKIIFASGFFAAALSMRSVFWFTTALLPTIALISGDLIYRRFAARNRRSKRVRSKPSFTLPSDSQ